MISIQVNTKDIFNTFCYLLKGNKENIKLNLMSRKLIRNDLSISLNLILVITYEIKETLH
jgi:hypothetical protein